MDEVFGTDDLTNTDVEDWKSSDRQVVRADISLADGCPILTRLKAFVAMQGVQTTLQHVFRDRANGRQLVLPDSAAASNTSIVLRVREAVATGASTGNNPIWEIYGRLISLTSGVVEAILPPAVVEQAGIYELGWGIKAADASVWVLVDTALLSVERSLFAADPLHVRQDQGPPTLAEIRLSIKDSSPAENMVLRDVEFSTEEVLDAIRRPIMYWNEVPPPVRCFTTRNFPYREHWRKAIAGYLFNMAADSYRRNHLTYQAGGMSIDDKNKEREYLAAGERLIQEYQAWVLNTKVAMNLRSVYASVGSAYGRGR